MRKVGAEALLIPVNVSAWAIAAGYLGLFALVILPAPLALVVGFVALRDLAKRPYKRGRGRAWFGVIVGAIGTTVLGVFTILIATGH